MATILQRLTRALSPTVIREIAKTAGLEPELAARGMSATVPVVILALADKAAQRDGPPTVFRMLPAAGSPMRGELAFVARAGVPGAVLAPVLGARAGTVGDRLDCALEFRASALLPIAAALVLGLTARIVDEQELDAAGLAELLALEAAELRNAAGPVARLVRKSLDADRHLAVIGESHLRATPALDGDFTVDESTRPRKGRVRADAVAAVRDALETISRMSPSDAPRFRRLVEDVARALGRGGHQSCLPIDGTYDRARRRPRRLAQGPMAPSRPTRQGLRVKTRP